MRGNTVKECKYFEDTLGYLCDQVFKITRDSVGRKAYKFNAPNGHVEFHIPSDSKRGREYKSRTIYARYYGSDPTPFGTSGKNNLHIPVAARDTDALQAAMYHIREMTPENSLERCAIDLQWKFGVE